MTYGITKAKRRKIEVYDEGRKRIDRYTVFIGNDVYGMSENPNSPQGFNQYDGSFTNEEKKNVIKNLKLKKVEFATLPKDVKKAIKERE